MPEYIVLCNNHVSTPTTDLWQLNSVFGITDYDYSKNGVFLYPEHSYAPAQVSSEIENWPVWFKGRYFIKTNDEAVWNSLRLLRQTNDDVIVRAIYADDDGEPVHIIVNEYGVPDHWPNGFMDTNEKLSAQILMGGINKRRTSREQEY